MGNQRPLRLTQLASGILLIALLNSSTPAVAQTVAGEPAAGASGNGGVAASGKDILNLDIEQLTKTPVSVPSMDMPVSTVTREASTIGRTPAAAFVITSEMIRRSGATCVPEVLRIVPGLEVAQVNSNTWAISCRGFNAVQSNKLLVLIDGRTVYNPDYGGVFWDMQDMLLEDIERIEVIRGPGGTLWGSNAVNGIISIITKNSKDTQGVYAMAGGGSQKQLMDGFHYGGKIGEDAYYRVYGKNFEQGTGFDPTGQLDDSWRQGRFGFRSDWEPDKDKSNIFTIQGDHFVGATNNSIIPTSPFISERQTGENILARWRHVIGEDSDWTLQTYYDNWSRIDSMQTENVTTFDVDFQYRFPLGDRHSITCGAGYRNVQSYFAGGDTFPYQDYPTPTPTFYKYFSTPYWTTNYPTQFVQDEISLVPDRWTFIMGCKLEENPYTNLEYQPSVRLMWTPDKKQTMWGAITRAVHTPTREDEQISVTIPTAYSPLAYARYEGDPNVTSEALIAYEVGYRAQVTDRFSWDVATFYNVYNSLEGVQNPATFWETLPDPAHFVWLVNPETVLSGESYGVELACNYKMSERWRLFAQYTYLHMQVQSTADITAATLADPNNRIALRSSWDLGSNMDFDLTARYVDRLIDPGISYAGMNVPAYIEMDMRLAWRPRDHWEVALVGQNLLHQHHYEFAGGNDSFPIYATEVPRSVYSTLTWRH